MAVHSVIKTSALVGGFRLDPEYYQPRYLKDSAIIDGVPVFVLGKGTLIRNKRAVGRPQDLADLSALEA